MEEAILLANKMIRVYNSTPIEEYPEARAIDVLDHLPVNDRTRAYAFNLFMAWHEQTNEHDCPVDPQEAEQCEACQ